ncbi:MAG TPA: hypothetical protein VKW77_10410, partial [Acidimicrobiales bacterium]|nr:hypothetical protein [Acidimicrobiales bacterium]
MPVAPRLLAVLAVVAAAVLLADAGVWATHSPSSPASPGNVGHPSMRAPSTSSTVTAGPPDPDVGGLVQAPAPGVYRYRATPANAKVPPSEFAVRITEEGTALNVTTERVVSTLGVDRTLEYTPGAEYE